MSSSNDVVAVKTNDIELNEHNKDGNVNNNDDDNGKVVKRGYFVSKFASYIGVEYEEDTETAPVMSYLGIILITIIIVIAIVIIILSLPL